MLQESEWFAEGCLGEERLEAVAMPVWQLAVHGDSALRARGFLSALGYSGRAKTAVPLMPQMFSLPDRASCRALISRTYTPL